MLGIAWGLGACVADPMLPCGAFESGERDVDVARPIAVAATKEGFVLRNLCDDAGNCRVDRLPLPELTAGSQVMLTPAGHFLVAIDQEDGGVWTHEFDDGGLRKQRSATYVHETDGPAKLVIGLRDGDSLVVRDRQGRLAIYEPGAYKAIPIAPELGDYTRLAAVGERHLALKVPHAEGKQALYLVDLGEVNGGVRNPTRPVRIATGDITSVVFGPGDANVVVSEGRGTEATVMLFDVEHTELVDSFAGEVVSAREENRRRALEELPGLHAFSPNGEQLAYRTTSGSLAVRHLELHGSCMVRNANRLGTDREPTRDVGDHAVAGFSDDGIVFAEYTVGRSDSYVYAFDPRGEEIVPLGAEDGDWHLSAVPGRVTAPDGDVEQLWAIGVRDGTHASIGEDGVDGETVGRELTFMARFDDAVWAIDTADQVVTEGGRSQRALSVRRVAPPRWAGDRLSFDQPPDAQVVEFFEQAAGDDSQGPLRVPLIGRLCLSTGRDGSWAFRCGDSTSGHTALTTNSGSQEQSDDPDNRPEFEPPFPDDDDEPSEG